MFIILDKIEALVRRVVREELEKAFVRDVTVEVHRKDPGNPKIETKRMSVIDYILLCSNHTEGALRGMQADLGRSYQYFSELGNQTLQTFKVICDALNSNGSKRKLNGEVNDVKQISRDT